MSHTRQIDSHARGFSMIEMLVSLTILAMVIAALSTVLIRATLVRMNSSNRFQSMQTARGALDLVARDIRTAGYGADATMGQPAIAYVDSTQLILCANLAPYPEDAAGPGVPVAYDPSGSPRPRPLVGSTWTPPIKYRTGAELVRYTLDLNDDGIVNGKDQDEDAGVDARRTVNPEDYTLVRQVYGDSSGGLAGNNGGSSERVALVCLPGKGVKPIFTVYLKGQEAAWDWSAGPVPAASVEQIERVEICITSPSPRPDASGRYNRTALETAVRSLRNAPDFGTPTYVVDGYVFEDQGLDGKKDDDDTGLAGVTVRLGSGRVAYTNIAGYYSFRVPAGQYVLRHSPPSGYGSLSDPDSFEVMVGPSGSYSFPDTSHQGGWVQATVWHDVNADKVQQSSEPLMSGVTVSVQPVDNTGVTGSEGMALIFSDAGRFTANVSPPDGFACWTTNPRSGTVVNGGTAVVSFGLVKANTGRYSGIVYNDQNVNKKQDAGEPGVAKVYVGVLASDGVMIVSSAYTDEGGKYSLSVPANDPPKNAPYTIFVTPPSGYFATTAAFTKQYLKVNQSLTRSFGINDYYISNLTSAGVACLTAADVWEGDGPSTYKFTKGDIDLIAVHDNGSTSASGSTSGSTYSAWYDAWAGAATVFAAKPSLNYTPKVSALAVCLDTLNTLSPTGRPDAVLGLRRGDTYNFSVLPNLSTAVAKDEKLFYLTADAGEVSAVQTLDLNGGAYPDVIVGTRSTTPGRGTLEVWRNDEITKSPNYLALTQTEIIPTTGGVPSSIVGEVNRIVTGDFDRDGLKDIAVATSTSSTSGKVLIFQNAGKKATDPLTCKAVIDFKSEAVNSVAAIDVNGDGYLDLVAGTQSSDGAGRLHLLTNRSAKVLFQFEDTQQVDAPGAVTALAVGDFGGDAPIDLAVGFRTSSSSFTGGVRLYFMDAGSIPDRGVDPSKGWLTSWVTSLAAGNFNYYLYPSPTAASTTDLAAGYRKSGGLGGTMVFTK